MNKELTFEDAIEQIKQEGEKTRETIEVAEQLAEIINAITERESRRVLPSASLQKCAESSSPLLPEWKVSKQFQDLILS